MPLLTAPAGDVVYSDEGEQRIEKGKEVTMLPTLPKEWKVQLEIKPTEFMKEDAANCLLFSESEQTLSRTSKILAISFRRIPENQLIINYILDTEKKESYPIPDRPIEDFVPLNQWTRIEVGQRQEEGKFLFFCVSWW